MLTRLIGAFLFSLLTTIEIAGQTLPYRSDKIIPASPTSAGLGRYGDIPVSFFNGSPNIQIPLYEIKTPAHSLQITMRYDASGTKVRQDASWVGLGWTLEAGGAVTRTIRQKDDLDQSRWGYYYAPTLPPSSNHDYTGNWQTDKSFFDNVYDGVYDAEPDIFSYNFCGKSGRFVIGKNAEGSSVFLDEKNNLKINYQNGGWVFIDGEGYKYYLNTKETEENYARSLQYELTTFDGLFYLTPDGNGNPASAWYLDSIVAPTNEKITFTYVKGKSLSLINFSEQFYKLYNYTNIACQGYTPQGLANQYHSYDYSRQDVTNVYLNKIEFANGSIEFKMSPRLDVEIGNPQGLLGPSKLDSIIIRNKTSVLSKYAFKYSYFNAATAEGRLKLDSIINISGNGVLIPPYKFEYYSPNDLPSKYSKSIDHWGFENSATNTTILPSTIISESIASFSGGDRDADESNNYPVKGVLSKMTYPTGGRTEFEYELHDYSNLSGEQAYRTVTKGATGYTNPELFPNDPSKIVNFTIPPYPGQTQVPVTIICSYQKTDMNNNNNDLANLGIGSLFLVNGSTATSKYSCITSQIDGNNPNEVSHQTTLNLPFGNYRIEMLSWTGWTYKMSVIWIEKDLIQLNQRKGGGIRIKSITNYDNAGVKSVKKYSYIGNDGKSSGVLMTEPKYDNSFSVSGTEVITVAGNSLPCSFSADYYSIMSSSIFPTSLTSRSGIVGYSKVTETDGENGKTEYYFKCFPEATDEFPSIPTYANPQNGELDSVLVYNASNAKLKKTTYAYSFKEMTYLKAVKLFTASPVTTGSDPLNNRAYRIRYYDNYSYWFVPNQDTETLFTSSGPITTTSKYYYNNNKHREVSQVDITKSDGNTLIKKYKRPDDYTVSGGTSFAEQMTAKHIISPVIEEQTLLNNAGNLQLLSGIVTSFKKYNNNFFRPDISYVLESPTPSTNLTESSFSSSGQLNFHPDYKPRLYFDNYNVYGNILQQHKSDDINEIYLWGYNSVYPVAKIVGSDYASAIALVNQTLLNNATGQYTDAQMRTELNKLRTGLPNAQVWTYTYAQLTGMTSETDPRGKITYYEHDGFGRLARVKDQDGKILKQYDYQYQQSRTN